MSLQLLSNEPHLAISYDHSHEWLYAECFSHVELYGQRFRDPRMLAAWEADVRGKIRACREGTRWEERPSLRSLLRRWRLVNWAYDVPALRSMWRTLRWGVPSRLQRARGPAYRWTDFEFVAADEPGVLWFCAALRP